MAPITLQDLDKLADNKPLFVVVLYANWCPHCQTMISRLGDKMKQYQQLRFFEESEISPQLREYYPRVIVYHYGVPQEGTLAYVYSLLHA